MTVWQRRSCFIQCKLLLLLLLVDALVQPAVCQLNFLWGAKAAAVRKDLVIYNRVPKSGSSTLQNYVDKLSKKLDYKPVHYIRPPHVKYRIVNHTRVVDHEVQDADIRRFAKFVSEMPRRYGRRVVIDYHFPYVNFTAIGLKQPLYINTLRDPVERTISQYYYAREGPRSDKDREKHKQHFGEYKVEDCIDIYKQCNCTGHCHHNMHCTQNRCADLFHNFNHQMMFFCPWGSLKCMNKDRVALEEAKAVLASQYVAFGILERNDDSLEVFEKTLPQYFKGITMAKVGVARKNDAKEEVESDMKKFLREVMALDVEFYQFAVQLFEQKFKHILQ